MNGGVIKKNMTAVRRLTDKAAVVTAGQIDEAVYVLTNAGRRTPSADEAAQLFTDAFCAPLLSPEFALLCAALFSSPPDAEGKAQSLKKPRVTYLKNAYSDAALDCFTEKATPDAVFEAVPDFRYACEAVISERSDMCILPLCSTADGHFQSFRRLIKSNELKIISKCNVSLPDTDTEMRFALLSRKCCPDKHTHYIDFSFVPSGDDDIPGLLTALGALGASVFSVMSSPLEYNIDKSDYSVSVKIAPDSACPLCRFLDAALPGYTLDGAYDNISESERKNSSD